MSISPSESSESGGSRLDRRAAERQKRQQYAARFEEGAMDAKAEIVIARVRAVGRIGRVAMGETAQVANAECFCASIAPACERRVRAMADTNAMTLLDILQDLPRALR